MLTSAVFLYPALVLFLCSSCAQGRRSLPVTRRQAPVPPTRGQVPASSASQNNGDERWDDIIYPAPVDFPDMSVNPRMSDYNDEVPESSLETSDDKGDIEHIILEAPVKDPYLPSDGDIVFNTRISDTEDTEADQHSVEQESSTPEPVRPMLDVFDAFKENYTLVDGLGYYRVVKSRKLGWEQARAACLAEGAHLAVVNSRHEAITLGRLYYGGVGIKPDLVIFTAWVGAYRPQGQQHYVTVHGTPLQKTGFSTGIDETHSNSTEESCVILDVSETKLKTTKCGLSEHHICEHEL